MSGIIFIGGFHELEEICELTKVNIVGAIDNAPSARSNAPHLGSDNDAEAVFKDNPTAAIHISPDKPQLRHKLWNKFTDIDNRAVQTIIHPTAQISNSTKIGDGCAIHMGAIISSANSIGKGVKINTGATITHDVIIEDFVTIAPRAVICSAATIETGVYIGANATIMPGVRIGANAIIGAGAVVTRDVEPGATVYGNPATVKGDQA